MNTATTIEKGPYDDKVLALANQVQRDLAGIPDTEAMACVTYIVYDMWCRLPGDDKGAEFVTFMTMLYEGVVELSKTIEGDNGLH